MSSAASIVYVNKNSLRRPTDNELMMLLIWMIPVFLQFQMYRSVPGKKQPIVIVATLMSMNLRWVAESNINLTSALNLCLSLSVYCQSKAVQSVWRVSYGNK